MLWFLDLLDFDAAGGLELFGMRGQVKPSDLRRLVPDCEKVPLFIINHVHAANSQFPKLHLYQQTLLFHIHKQQLVSVQLYGQNIFWAEVLNCD